MKLLVAKRGTAFSLLSLLGSAMALALSAPVLASESAEREQVVVHCTNSCSVTANASGTFTITDSSGGDVVVNGAERGSVAVVDNPPVIMSVRNGTIDINT